MDHIYDVRPCIERNEGGIQRTARLFRQVNAYASTGTPGRMVAFSVNYEGVINGKRGWIKTNQLLGPNMFTPIATFGSIIDPDHNTTADGRGTNHYLYLAPWYGFMPRGQRIMCRTKPSTDSVQRFDSRGILVLSTVPPAAQGEQTNGAAIRLPHPWSSYNVPAGEATLVCALKKTTADGYVMQSTDMSNNFIFDSFNLYSASGVGVVPVSGDIDYAGGTTPGAGRPPVNAQSAIVEFTCVNAGASIFFLQIWGQVDSGVADATAFFMREQQPETARRFVVPVHTLVSFRQLFLAGTNCDILYALFGWTD